MKSEASGTVSEGDQGVTGSSSGARGQPRGCWHLGQRHHRTHRDIEHWKMIYKEYFALDSGTRLSVTAQDEVYGTQYQVYLSVQIVTIYRPCMTRNAEHEKKVRTHEMQTLAIKRRVRIV